MSLSRRQFLGSAALLGAGSVGSSGCGSFVASGLTGGEGNPRTINYWNLFEGGDGVRMKNMLSAFSQRHPEINVESVTIEWGDPFYTKLSLATLGDQPPEVATSHLTRVGPLARAGLLQELHTDDLARHGITADKFVRRAWDRSHVDGRLYAVPLDTHPFVCYYNTEICERAGLLDSSGALRPLRGRDEFIGAFQAAKEAGAQWGGVVGIIADQVASWRFFQTLFQQAGGGDILAERGKRVTLDEDVAVDVLELMQSLTGKENVMPDNMDTPGAIAAFADGRAGFYFQGEWEVTTFETAGTPFSMTRFPHVYLDAEYAVQGDSHSLVLPVWPDSSQERFENSLTLIRGMLNQSYIWAKGGHVPVWLPVQQSKAYQDLDPQSNYADAARYTVYDPPAWYSGSGSNFMDVVGSAVSAVLAGRISPRAAVRRMRSGLQDLADTPSPIV